MTGDEIARLSYLVLLGAAVAGWFFMQNRESLGKTAQQAAIWGLIFLGTIAGVGLWTDIRSDVAPRQQAFSDGRIVAPMSRDGHYHLRMEVNGTPVSFLVDTGATEIVLSRQDAARAGIDAEDLAYVGSAMTANGTVPTAVVTLDTVSLGGVTERDVRATVTDGPLTESLLGMSFLNRLASVQITGGELILTR